MSLKIYPFLFLTISKQQAFMFDLYIFTFSDLFYDIDYALSFMDYLAINALISIN